MPMPAITTTHLHWSTPDGRRVLSDLNLTFGSEGVGIVGRNGIGKSTLVKLLAGELQPSAGTIGIDGSVATMRQIVQVGSDGTIADFFGVRAAIDLLRKTEQGLADIDELAEADWTLEARLAAALAQFDLNVSPDTPLASLSGGQRTRAAMAGAIFARPDFLLLDEPSNNLDEDGRAALVDLLGNWAGGAIVVSHDRALLEHMDAIVELTSLGATRYGGNWSQYRARKDIEFAAAQHDLAIAERHIAETSRKAQTAVERKARRDAAGQRKGARGDMPRILIGARKQRAENSGGDNARLADRQRVEAEASASDAQARIERLQTLAIQLAPTGLPANKLVLDVDRISFAYPAGRPILRDLSFQIIGPERIALDGANGSGKTTLLALIGGVLAPSSGCIRRGTRFAMLDQTISILDRAVSIADNFQRLNPAAGNNACRAALARLRFRADAALRIVATLSGGEMLRAALACVLGTNAPPPLLILDEPTNHLDIDSLAAVEAGLNAFDGALLVVSHDRPFIDAIGVSRRIALNPDDAA